MARFKWAELKGGDGVLVRRTGSANFEDLSTQISQWLGNKGFDVRVLQVKPGGSLIQAREPTSLKTAIGASAPLEVELSPDSAGTLVDVRMGKVGGSVWMARFLTYSWVGLGVTFLPLKKELEEFVRGLEVDQGAGSQAPGYMTLVGVFESGRSVNRLGTEERRIDNSSGVGDVRRTITVTKRWIQSCRVEHERTQVNGLSAELKMLNLVTLGAQADSTIRKNYAVSSDVEQTFEETIDLNVPKGASMVLRMEWKQIVQYGWVRFRNQCGEFVDLPFRVDVGLTFDQGQSRY